VASCLYPRCRLEVAEVELGCCDSFYGGDLTHVLTFIYRVILIIYFNY
jgi:hypothetical protein